MKKNIDRKEERAVSPPAKPDNLFATLAALGRLGLVVIGLIGIVVHMFRESGWLNQLINKTFTSTAWLLAIPVTLVLLHFIDRWLSRVPRNEPYKRGDIPLYIMMGVGAFFLGKLIFIGHW
jgi:hypothetical protein